MRMARMSGSPARLADYDDSGWEILPATQLDSRRGTGKVSFNWYRIDVAIPERVSVDQVQRVILQAKAKKSK